MNISHLCVLLNKNSVITLTLRLLFIILITLSIFSTKAVENKILIHPVKLEYYDFYNKFTAIGQCKSEQSKAYYAQLSGTIDSISITQGKYVSAGDFLLSIDKNIAEAKKAKSQAAFESAETTYEKDLSLFKKKFISSELLAKSKVALEIAKLDLTNTVNHYSDMIITAPYDGYIGVIKARIGDDVKTGDYLFSLVADTGDKTIFVELPENMYSKIDKDSLIYAYDINNKKIQGRVVAVSNYLNDNGTITAKLAFDSDSKLIHGSYIEIEIIFNQHKALAIPEKIILKNNKGNFVYKITKNNKVKQVYINIGTRADNMIEVLSDEIQFGDLLVLNGLTKVYDGATIEIIKDSNKEQSSNN